MIVKEIVDIMQTYAPDSIALDFDNVGLLVGSETNTINGIAVALDVTMECIESCIKDSVNLLIVHHPIIFNPIKSVSSSTYVGQLLLKLLQNNINVLVMHTNMDNADCGINHTLAKMIGCDEISNLMEDGSGVKGVLKGVNFNILISDLAIITGDNNIRSYGQDKKVSNVAIISGAGGRDEDVIKYLKINKIDTFISGEFKYSIILELVHMGVNVIDVSHYECEKIFIEIVSDILIKEKTTEKGIYKYYL